MTKTDSKVEGPELFEESENIRNNLLCTVWWYKVCFREGVLLLGWPGLEMIFLFVVGGGVVAVGVAALAANGRGVLAESRRRCGCCCCWRAGGTCGTSRGCSGGCSGVGVVAG